MADGKSSRNIYLLLIAATVGGGCLIGALSFYHANNVQTGYSGVTGRSASIGSLAGATNNLSQPPQLPLSTASSNAVESPEEMRAQNDNAVKLIGQRKNDLAIEALESLLRRHPRYVRARENLCVAYNNKVVTDGKNNSTGLDLLRRAVSLDGDNPEAMNSLNTLLKCTGRDPQKFEDRVFLGDEQAKKNCLYGAYVEYSAALAIHNDVATVAKRAAIVDKMAVSANDDPNGAFYIRMAKRGEAAQNIVGDNSVDFASYLANLQNTVRDHWKPANSETDEKIEVSFTIAVDGTLSNIAVAGSTGDKEADQAAVDAVKTTGKAEPLPLKASVPIEITLHFEQGRSDSGPPRKIVH